jgi:hypothetical protein
MGHKRAHSAINYWTVYKGKPRSEYTVSCIFFALLWSVFFYLFFVHFRLPRVNHLDHIKVSSVKRLMAYNYIIRASYTIQQRLFLKSVQMQRDPTGIWKHFFGKIFLSSFRRNRVAGSTHGVGQDQERLDGRSLGISESQVELLVRQAQVCILFCWIGTHRRLGGTQTD